VLQDIFELLEDALTLCTLRLVSKPVMLLASSTVRTLTLPYNELRTRYRHILTRFPLLTRVSVSGVTADEEGMQMLARPVIRDALTDLQIVQDAVSTYPISLPPFLHLTSLTFTNFGAPNRFTFPEGLRALHLDQAAALPDVPNLNRLTKLTSLRIAILGSNMTGYSFEHVTILTSLEKLDIRCSHWYIERLCELTNLTELTWTPTARSQEQELRSLAPFVHLPKLVHLTVKADGYRNTAHSTGPVITRRTTLKSLDLLIHDSPRNHMPAKCLRRLELTRLAFSCGFLDGVPSKGAMATLRDLTLTRAALLDDAGVYSLGNATGLTQLEIHLAGEHWRFRPQGLLKPLSRMPRLKGLSLVGGEGELACSTIVRILPGLTKLQWAGRYVTDADLAACAAMTDLHVLSLSAEAFHRAVASTAIIALAELPDLTKLELSETLGVTGSLQTCEAYARRTITWHPRRLLPLDLKICYWHK
jgi:hypothetical protein